MISARDNPCDDTANSLKTMNAKILEMSQKLQHLQPSNPVNNIVINSLSPKLTMTSTLAILLVCSMGTQCILSLPIKTRPSPARLITTLVAMLRPN